MLPHNVKSNTKAVRKWKKQWYLFVPFLKILFFTAVPLGLTLGGIMANKGDVTTLRVGSKNWYKAKPNLYFGGRGAFLSRER